MIKKLIISFIIACASLPLAGSAQPYYYNAATQLHPTPLGTYKHDNKYGFVTLYKESDRFTYVSWGHKDGSQMSRNVFRGITPTIEDDNWTRLWAGIYVTLALSFDELKLVINESVRITMFIDPDTGKVVEVKFKFFANTPLAQISPATYAAIAEKLKAGLWFVPTEEGKKFNYLTRGWEHSFKS